MSWNVLLLSLSFCFAIGFSFLCLLLGRIIRKAMPFDDNLALDFVVGHVAMCLVLQLLASFYLFSRPVVIGLFIAILLGACACRAFPPPLSRRGLSDIVPQGRSARSLALLSCLSGIALLLCALTYPKTDALAYYLAQPKLVAAMNGYKPLPQYESFATLSLIGEMPFAVMYLFGGDTWGQVMSKLSMWPVAVANLMLLWALGRRLALSINGSWLLVAAGLTSSAFMLVAWDGKTDLVALQYALGAALLVPGRASGRALPAAGSILGALAAGAVIAKFSYALVLPFCLGVPILRSYGKHWRGLLAFCLRAGCAALIVFALGWWIKNLILFHEPFAPFFLFHKATPSFSLEQVWFKPEDVRWIVATYPLAVTFGVYPMQHGGVSALWLMLLPALGTAPWRNSRARPALWLAIGSLAGLLAWMLTRPSVIAPRYFLPALLLPLPFLIHGYDAWLQRRSPMAPLAEIATSALLCLYLLALGAVAAAQTRPYVAYLVHGSRQHLPANLSRALRLADDARDHVRVLLLSYSSESIPSRMLKALFTQKDVKGDIYRWLLDNKIDYVIQDTASHACPGLGAAAIPPGLSVEKDDSAGDAHLLYILRRTDG